MSFTVRQNSGWRAALGRAAAVFALVLAGQPLAAQPKAPQAGNPQAEAARAEPGASAWSHAPKSRARIVSAGARVNGAYAAGVEIVLDGDALTYWRNPGDAGVPPEFDFEGSTNLASANVSYPAPERLDEEGSEAFGWRGGVIFPLTIAPKDPAKPVTVALTLRYAACEKICIPSDGRMELTLAPGASPSPHAARIAQWLARVPRPAAEAGATFALEPIAGAEKPSWRVRVAPPEAGGDLFAEGEEGWYFDTRSADGDFRLVLAERPPGAANMTSVRLTLRRASGAVEFATTLDAGGATP